MRSIVTSGLLALALLAAAPAARAQEEEGKLQESYAEKLEKEFVGKIQWVRSFDQARATAKKEGKLVLGYFSRSYAP